jgi:hypothetical protein
MSKKTNHWARWAFAIFGGLLIVINAALTFSFGYTYLGRSFGSGLMSDYAGAFYAILIFDAAYLAWFYTFLRTAESTGQRSLAVGMAGFSLLGSLSATLQQLATNANDLVDLSAYHQTVGLIALMIMLFMTAAHVLAMAGYFLMSPQERVRQTMAQARGQALEDGLETATRMVNLDYDEIVGMMALKIRTNILDDLGFTHDLKQITSPTDAAAQQLFAPREDVFVLQESAPETPLVIDNDTTEQTDNDGGDENFTKPLNQ